MSNEQNEDWQMTANCLPEIKGFFLADGRYMSLDLIKCFLLDGNGDILVVYFGDEDAYTISKDDRPDFLAALRKYRAK